MRIESKRYFDYFGLSYFSALSTMMLCSAFYSMPHVYQGDVATLRSRQALSVFLLVEVMLNFVLVLRNKSFFLTQEVLHKKQVHRDLTRRSCGTCVQFIPPRAHHCPLCEKCVLKRDHHCFFVGTCIGFYNQRYFVVFCFYCTIASAYAVYVNAYYLMMTYYISTETSLWNFCPPVTIARWLFNYTTSDMLYHVILTYLCAITTTGVGGIFLSQFVLVILGSTTYEFWRTKGILKRFSLSHFKSVFGPLWWVNFILPMPCLKQSGNGIDWGDPKLV